ncbi:MAG: hypothetical protein LBT17_03945 [Mycoplasmataceae bacterium]|jgi:hypothetical protein|nr:hypothetical protein [Mycoplasmataceae bacterium]
MALLKVTEMKEINRKVEIPPTIIHKSTYSHSGDLFEIQTYGSSHRKNPESVSQTITIDRQSAIELIKILKIKFGL